MPEKTLNGEHDLVLPAASGAVDMPVSICEVDPGSWGEEPGRLADYIHDMGFTHYKSPPEIEPLKQRGIGIALDADAHTSGQVVRYSRNVRWASDTLAYFSQDPLYRAYHHHLLIASVEYAWTGNLVLPLGAESGSPISSMPGDEWQRCANLRLLYGYMTAYPGKKLMSLGEEFHVPEGPNRGLPRWVRDLNTFYRGQPALYVSDSDPAGFAWVDSTDNLRSIVSFRRIGRDPREQVLFLFNFTPVPRQNYRAGVPEPGLWLELLNSDAALYGGSGHGNLGSVDSSPVTANGLPHSLNLTLPPLAMLAFQRARQ